MTSTNQAKEATLTLLREISKKQLTRADGKAFVVHNLVARSEKGNEFPCSMFTDLGEDISIGETRQYQVSSGKREGEWVIRPIRDQQKKGQYQSRMGQEIHAAAMQVAADLLIAGKISTVDEMIRLSQELATVMVSDWRKY